MGKPSPERSRADLGRSNRRSVISQILFNGPIARTEIAERTGLTGASVSRITRDLINAGLVAESDSTVPQPRSGRRYVELNFAAGGGYVLAIGIHAFEQWVSLADLKNNVLLKKEIGIDTFTDAELVLDRAAAVAEAVIKESGIDRSRILGAGVAIAGAVEPEQGAIRESSTLGWGRVEVEKILAGKLAMPCCVESLPNAMNLAETRFGIARDSQNVILINASLRIGGSLLLDKNLRRGSEFSAGMIGRLRLQGDSGEVSDRRLDHVAGGLAILEALEPGRFSLDTSQCGSSAARCLLSYIDRSISGDPQASQAFARAARWLGQAIDTLLVLLQPQTILLAGPLARVPAFVDELQRAFEQSSAFIGGTAEFRVSQMNNEVAARYLALNEFLAVRDIDPDRFAQQAAS